MAGTSLSGVGATPLSGVGTARWYDATVTLPEEPDDTDPDAERDRFEAAVEAAEEEVRAERDRTVERIGEDEAEIFDAHLQFLRDPRVTEDVESAIGDGRAAPHAVDAAFSSAIADLEAASGMIAERADDLRDVRDRLLRILVGDARASVTDLSDGSVVLAERLTPSDTAELEPDAIAGFATVEGGRTSHAAIMARSLGVPAVVGVGDELAAIDDGTEVLVDGDAGEVVVAPDADERAAAAADRDRDVVRESVTTRDGTAVEVAANIGSPREAAGALERGADGVGLFRTEFFFLDRDAPPDENEQYEAFVDVLEAFDGGRVIVRTLDVGGDKPVPYLDVEAGTNPFLGYRGIRMSLGDDAGLFETQLRALLRAAATEHGGGLAVMFPLVTTLEELSAALDRVDEVADDLAAEGVPHAVPELGVMVETPAAVRCAADLAVEVDFLSIGTNDLTQYTMAASREDDRVDHLHDPRHPAVLRAIRATVEAGHASDAWVGMCGEMAGDPDLTRFLVGIGLDELSMSAVTIPDVKRAIARTDVQDARSLAERALDARTLADVRALLDE